MTLFFSLNVLAGKEVNNIRHIPYSYNHFVLTEDTQKESSSYLN